MRHGSGEPPRPCAAEPPPVASEPSTKNKTEASRREARPLFSGRTTAGLLELERFPRRLKPGGPPTPVMRDLCSFYNGGLDRLEMTGLGGRAANFSDLTEQFIDYFAVACEFMLSRPDSAFFDEGQIHSIVFINDLVYLNGNGTVGPSTALAIPPFGLILINLTHLQAQLQRGRGTVGTQGDVGWVALDRVFVVWHEIFHHHHHRLMIKVGDGPSMSRIEEEDMLLSALLDGHQFPKPGEGLEYVSPHLRARLPRKALYSLTGPQEMIANAAADICLCMGQRQPAQRAMLGYWLARTRNIMPATHKFLEHDLCRLKGQDGASCPVWLRLALAGYRQGSHDDKEPMEAALEKLRTSGSLRQLLRGEPQTPAYGAEPFPAVDRSMPLTAADQQSLWEWVEQALEGPIEPDAETPPRSPDDVIPEPSLQCLEELPADLWMEADDEEATRLEEQLGGKRKRRQKGERRAKAPRRGHHREGSMHAQLNILNHAARRVLPASAPKLQVRLDIKGRPAGVTMHVPFDLGETGAQTLWRVVRATLGDRIADRGVIPNFRLIGPSFTFTLRTSTRTGTFAVQGGTVVTLAPRMRGGGGEGSPSEPTAPEPPESPPLDAGEAMAESEAGVGTTPLAPPPPAEQPSSGLDFSPPYRPAFETESTSRPAAETADGGMSPADAAAAQIEALQAQLRDSHLAQARAQDETSLIKEQFRTWGGAGPEGEPPRSAPSADGPRRQSRDRRSVESSTGSLNTAEVPPESRRRARFEEEEEGVSFPDYALSTLRTQLRYAAREVIIGRKADSPEGDDSEPSEFYGPLAAGTETLVQFANGQALPIAALEAEALGEALHAFKDTRKDERAATSPGRSASQIADFDAHTDACLNMLHDFGPQWARRLNRMSLKQGGPSANKMGPPRRSPQVHPTKPSPTQPPSGDTEVADKTPRYGGGNPRVLHADSEPSRAWKYGPDGRPSDKQPVRGESPQYARDAGYSGSDTEGEMDNHSEYSSASRYAGSVANETNGSNNGEVFDIWQNNIKNTFTVAPTREQLEAANLSPAVMHAVTEARALRYRSGTCQPTTAAFDLTCERLPLTSRTTSRIDVTAGRPFFSKAAMRSESRDEQMNQWLLARPQVISTLRAGVTARQDSKLLLDKLVDQVIDLRGASDNLSCLCSQIVAELSPYVCLAATAIVWAIDEVYLEGFTPEKQYRTSRRLPGESLLSLISRVELLLLASMGVEHLSRSILYSSEFSRTNAAAVTSVHDQIIAATRAGSQPWSHELAAELSIAFANARALAKSRSVEERPQILQATSCVFACNLVGKDRAWSESYGKTDRTRTTDNSRNVEGRREKVREQRPVGAVTRSFRDKGDTNGKSGPPAQQQQQQTPPSQRPPRNGQDPETSGTDAYNSAKDKRYRIDWTKVQAAGMGDKSSELYPLAVMLWPTDDCSGYNVKLHEAGEPKANTVMRTSSGAIRLRPDQSQDVRYLAPKSCLFCHTWSAKASNGIKTKGPIDSGHNPKGCSAACAELLRRPHGAHFLEERSKGRYK